MRVDSMRWEDLQDADGRFRFPAIGRGCNVLRLFRFVHGADSVRACHDCCDRMV